MMNSDSFMVRRYKMGSFNLLDEAWIPVSMLDGTKRSLGLKDIFRNAGSILAIEHTSPLIVGSVYRLLLAVLYRAFDGPSSLGEASRIYEDGLSRRLPDIHDYLERWRERFYLFDDAHPFFQVPDYMPKSRRYWTALAAEMNDDNSKVLFDHTGFEGLQEDFMALDPINHAEAALFLLATQAFSVCKGKSEFQYTKGAPIASSAAFIVQGTSLEDSLLLMLHPYPNKEVQQADLPVWERPPLSSCQLKEGISREISGYADLYTWMSRSVKLLAENDGKVHSIGLASGVVDDNTLNLEDPMCGFRTDQKFGRLPLQFGERGLWRNFDSLIPSSSADCAPKVVENAIALMRRSGKHSVFSLLAVGQSNDKAKIEFWRQERYSMPEAMLSDLDARGIVQSAIRLAEDYSQPIIGACRTYAKKMLSGGDRDPDMKDVTSFLRSATAIQDYWTGAERGFHELLSAMDTQFDPDEVEDAWRDHLRRTALKSWDDYMASQTGIRSIVAQAHGKRTLMVKLNHLSPQQGGTVS